MTIEQNKIIAKRFIEALGTLDPDLVGSFMRDSCIFLTMSRSCGIEIVRRQSGTDYCRQMAFYATNILPNGFRLDVTGMVAEGNFVAVEADGYGEVSEGRIYNNAYHFLLEIIDGKIETAKEYCDFLHASETLSISETPQ